MTAQKVSINGEQREVATGTTIASLISEFVGGSRGVAVAVNAEIVPRSQWAVTCVGDGDRVELLRAAQGG
jgi:sulfur carrier protein